MYGNDRAATKKLSIDEVISNKGYFDRHGEWNSVLQFKKYPNKLFRGRVEVFIFRDDTVYMEIYSSGEYRVPGGSFDIRRSNHDQAYNEAKEEARLIIHNIKYTGYSYHKLKSKHYISKDDKTISWDGTFNKIYTADFSGYYTGNVQPYAQDNAMYKYGRFISIFKVWNLLSEDHKIALQSKMNSIKLANK